MKIQKHINAIVDEKTLIKLGFETTKFPQELCTIPNEKEENVFNAAEDVQFLCVIQEKQNSTGRGWLTNEQTFCLMILQPYIVKDPTNESAKTGSDVYFGWVNVGEMYFDHKDRAIHDDDDVIVAWKAI